MTTGRLARPDAQIPLRLDLYRSIEERAQAVREALARVRVLSQQFDAIEARKEQRKEKYRRL